METQLGAKCVSKLQKFSSVTAASPLSRTNTPTGQTRRNSAAAVCPPNQQPENSWPRPPPTSRSHLSVPRRSNASYGQQNLWLQRPGVVNRTLSTGDWKSNSDGDSEKRNMTPPQTPSTPSAQQQPLPMSRERHPSANVEVKQQRLEQRTMSVMHRLRRLQYGQSRSHVDGELQSCNNSLRRALDSAACVRDAEAFNDVRALLNDTTLEQKLETLIKNGELRPEFLNCDELRHATPAAMAHILKKHEGHLKRIIALSTSSKPIAAPSGSTSSMNTLPTNVALGLEDRQHLGRVTHSLQSHLSCLQREYDSDATESSSGGESCDEDEKETEQSDTKPSGKFRSTPLEHRASYQWWTERGWIGSRWSWIQFQLADLEYKIRQHVDLYKQLRCRKQKQTSSLPAMLNKNAIDGLNAKIRPAQKTNDGENTDADEASAADGCARTRPYEVGNSRRRLIKTTGMYRWNRKTFVRSTTQCGCTPPYSPCITCSGRLDNTEPVSVQNQTMAIRNSILEPAYHPVLSLPYRGRGIGLERRLQAYWGAPKPPVRNLSWFPQQKAVVTLLPNSREHQGSYVKESPSDGSSEKPRRRKKPDGPIPPKRSYSMVNRHRAAKLKRAKKFKREWSRSDVMAAGSFLSSSLSQDDNGACAGKLGNRRTTDRQSTFDIDNIVVDPKVAAVTRVEKLQYKEIQTPKWRILEFPELTLAKLAQEKEMEDVSDVAFTDRHGIKEDAEKKRFIPILFRDLHSTTRRGHLSQSSSVDSNGTMGTLTPTTPIVATASAPANLNSVTLHERPSFEIATPAERGYEPFSPRHFPLEDVDMEEMCNGNSNNVSHSKFVGGDPDRPPSV